jgi:hypothetical protein
MDKVHKSSDSESGMSLARISKELVSTSGFQNTNLTHTILTLP